MSWKSMPKKKQKNKKAYEDWDLCAVNPDRHFEAFIGSPGWSWNSPFHQMCTCIWNNLNFYALTPANKWQPKWQCTCMHWLLHINMYMACAHIVHINMYMACAHIVHINMYMACAHIVHINMYMACAHIVHINDSGHKTKCAHFGGKPIFKAGH